MRCSSQEGPPRLTESPGRRGGGEGGKLGWTLLERDWDRRGEIDPIGATGGGERKGKEREYVVSTERDAEKGMNSNGIQSVGRLVTGDKSPSSE